MRWSTPGVSSTRPAGRMRPAKLFCAARSHVHELKNILDKKLLAWSISLEKNIIRLRPPLTYIYGAFRLTRD